MSVPTKTAAEVTMESLKFKKKKKKSCPRNVIICSIFFSNYFGNIFPVTLTGGTSVNLWNNSFLDLEKVNISSS